MTAALTALVLGSADNPKLLQDTPIQGDVWLAFDKAGGAASGAGTVDLLLVPTRDRTAGEVVMAMRKVLALANCTARLAQLPGVVAAQMDFATFMLCIVPATKWWHDCNKNPASKGCASGRAWLARVAKELGHDGPLSDHMGVPIIGRVGLNRTFETASTQSCRTVKADAARQLFGVETKRLTWAVLDVGINSQHPAFRDHDCPKAGSRVVATYDFVGLIDRLDAIETGVGEGEAHEAMMGRLRANLVAKLPEGSVFPKDIDRQAKALLKRLRERLQAGRDLDWTLFEFFVLMPKPTEPARDHGTQVAGIIGGDWRVADGPPDDEPMTGMCPDIKLIDMRVVDDGSGAGRGRSTEFDVIAALQFLRFLNDRSEARKWAVHGANLSLSTPHDVRMYGCGSTLVCQECDRLSASGVVVVACAGNGGHVGRTDGPGGQYQAMSITDPGNAASVITVGATHALEPHRYGVSWFSSRGPTGDGRCKPDLVAPGERIVAPRVDTGSSDEDTGTSFAAPHVSGAAALLIARHAELAGQPARIKAILCATATDLGRERHFQGAGLLDTLRALQSV